MEAARVKSEKEEKERQRLAEVEIARVKAEQEEKETTRLSSVVNEIMTEEPTARSVIEDKGEEETDESESPPNKTSSVEIILATNDAEFFIQHIVFSERAQAEDYVVSYSGLQNAMIVPIISGENRLLAVISGPFQSRVSADRWAKEFELPADFWIRSAGLLKRVVTTNE